MKKNILFISLLFLTKIIFCQTSLNGIIEYQSFISENKINDYLKSKRASLDKTNLKKYDEIYLSPIKINSKLIFSEDESIFTIDKKLNIKKKKVNYRLIESWSGGVKVYYSNSKLKINKVKNCKTLGDCFLITSKFKQWELTQETKQISGYTCYKAIRTIIGRKGKKDVFAWYAPAIPVNFGPKGESGLPGLILELELGAISFKVKKIVLNPKEKVVIKKLNKGKNISEKEFKILVGKAADKILGNR